MCLLMFYFFSTGPTWSYWPSRTCWSTRPCCECLTCIKCCDDSVPHLLYLSDQQHHKHFFLIVTSSGCRWWAWSQRSAGSVWPEGRWRIKGIPWTSRPSWAAGVDCKDHIWLLYTFIIQKKTTIKSSVLFSGLAWSTWWERWNWRRWSNGKILIVTQP